jgi:hypothetical protein
LLKQVNVEGLIVIGIEGTAIFVLGGNGLEAYFLVDGSYFPHFYFLETLILSQRSPQKNKHKKRAIVNFRLGLFLTYDSFVSQSDQKTAVCPRCGFNRLEST